MKHCLPNTISDEFTLNISHLPYQGEDKRFWPIECVLSLFWLMVFSLPLTLYSNVLTNPQTHTPIETKEIIFGMLWCMIALHIAFKHFKNIFYKVKIVIDNHYIIIQTTNFHTQTTITEPRKNYTAIHHERFISNTLYTQRLQIKDILYLQHKTDPSKSMPLFATLKDNPTQLRQYLQKISTIFKLPVIEETANETLRYQPQDVSKALYQLIKERKVKIKHNPDHKIPTSIQVNKAKEPQLTLLPETLNIWILIIPILVFLIFLITLTITTKGQMDLTMIIMAGGSVLIGVFAWLILQTQKKETIQIKKAGLKVTREWATWQTLEKTLDYKAIKNITLIKHSQDPHQVYLKITGPLTNIRLGTHLSFAHLKWLKNYLIAQVKEQTQNV